MYECRPPALCMGLHLRVVSPTLCPRRWERHKETKRQEEQEQWLPAQPSLRLRQVLMTATYNMLLQCHQAAQQTHLNVQYVSASSWLAQAGGGTRDSLSVQR
jgi:hypothetical protein